MQIVQQFMSWLKFSFYVYIYGLPLTPKAPIITVADDKFCDIFSNFRKKQGMILHESRLPADNSHEISCLFVIFEKAAKFEIVVCCKKQVSL